MEQQRHASGAPLVADRRVNRVRISCSGSGGSVVSARGGEGFRLGDHRRHAGAVCEGCIADHAVALLLGQLAKLPRFVGLAEFCRYLGGERKNQVPTTCRVPINIREFDERCIVRDACIDAFARKKFLWQIDRARDSRDRCRAER